MASLAEVKEKLDVLRYQGHQIMIEAGPTLDFTKVRCIDGSPEEKTTKWQALQMEMTEAGAEYDRLKLVETQMKANEMAFQMDNRPVNSPPLPFSGVIPPEFRARPETIDQLINNSPEWKTLRERNVGTARIEIADRKALITMSDMPPTVQRGPLVHMAMETRTVIDAIGTSPMSGSTIEWYEETTFTNTAAETAEGVAKPEATLDWTLRTSTAKMIAVWIPVTVQALQDTSFMDSEIRNRLLVMIDRREETQVLTGNGVGENLRGILATVGIQTMAKGADAEPSAILKALQLVRGSAGLGYEEPDLIVIHPADYTQMITLQTVDGNYLWQAVIQNSPEPRLWGIPIRQTGAMTENTVLVGAFAVGAEVFRAAGTSVVASTEHASYFIENKVAIRAESRIALAVQRPAVFCTVTAF